jgi:nicotinamidase-related amidase
MTDWRLTTENCALVAVDVQEKLMAAMPRRAETVAGVRKLAQAARILNIPTLVTLQYVKGLGPLCPEIAEVTTGINGIEKLTFSCCGTEAFTQAIKDLRRQRIILCGVESHVCVQQTAIDLMGLDKFVYICADATCSRRDLDHQTAIERLRDCGAVITTVESAVFEILRQAGTDAFKQCLPLWK